MFLPFKAVEEAENQMLQISVVIALVVTEIHRQYRNVTKGVSRSFFVIRLNALYNKCMS